MGTVDEFPPKHFEPIAASLLHVFVHGYIMLKSFFKDLKLIMHFVTRSNMICLAGEPLSCKMQCIYTYIYATYIAACR